MSNNFCYKNFVKNFYLKGFQRSQNGSKEILPNWLQFEDNDQGNLIEDGSTTSLVNLGHYIDDDDMEAVGDEDDMIPHDGFTGTTRKQRRELKKCIKINQDMVKFFCNKPKYLQELSEKLEKLSTEVELIPEKSLIMCTKKHRSRYTKDWHKRCCSIVTKFCSGKDGSDSY